MKWLNFICELPAARHTGGKFYRADDPNCIERSMNGYLFESEALQEGRGALHRHESFPTVLFLTDSDTRLAPETDPRTAKRSPSDPLPPCESIDPRITRRYCSANWSEFNSLGPSVRPAETISRYIRSASSGELLRSSDCKASASS